MKITKKQLGKLVEQVVSDHLKTGPTVKLKKVIQELQKLGIEPRTSGELYVTENDLEKVVNMLKQVLSEVEDLEKRVSDAAWRDNPGMGMERDF